MIVPEEDLPIPPVDWLLLPLEYMPPQLDQLQDGQDEPDAEGALVPVVEPEPQWFLAIPVIHQHRRQLMPPIPEIVVTLDIEDWREVNAEFSLNFERP